MPFDISCRTFSNTGPSIFLQIFVILCHIPNIEAGLISYTIYFKQPPKRKSKGVKSGEWAGHSVGPQQRSGNYYLNSFLRV